MAITDENLWLAEERFWTGGVEAFDDQVAEECLIVLDRGGVLTRDFARAATAANGGWSAVNITGRHTARIGRTNVVLGYRAKAQQPGAAPYHALCSSTYRGGDDGWKLIQHQQTVVH